MIVNKKSLYLFKSMSDLLLLNFSFLAAAVLAQSWQTLLERYYMFFLLAGLNLSWLIMSNVSGLYNDFQSRNFPFQLVIILKETVLQVLLSVLFIFLLKEELFTRNFIIYYAVLLIFLISIRSIVFRKILKSLRKKGINIRNLLIIGTGSVARRFKDLINSNPDFGYKFSGFVSEDTFKAEEIESVGTIDELDELIPGLKIDEAVIALSIKDNQKVISIIQTCDRKAIRVHIIPDYFTSISNRFQVSMFGDFPIITARREPLEEVHWRIYKRAFDIIFSSLVILLVLWWFYLLVFFISKLTSPGPVLFIQNRIGAKNKKFRCIKFRTMRSTIQKPELKFKPVIENDPRITKIGRFLRKSNLDELPQFINVLKGDMSVVGPRPHSDTYEKVYVEMVEAIKIRYNVRPGITGWAQVHGLRGDVVNDEENKKLINKRIEFDLWYIENWSMTLDFQVIMVTIWQMLVRRSKGSG